MNHLSKTMLAVVWIGSYLVPAQAQLYVVNRDAGTISEYNADTGALINGSLISGLSEPCALALAGGDLFVTELGDGLIVGAGTVGKYDATTGATINVSLVTGLTSPQGVAVSGNNLYVTSLDGQGTGMVGKYDATTGAAINALLVSRLESPFGVGVSDNKLFVTYGNGLGAIGEYDATSGAVIEYAFVQHVATPCGLVQSGSNIWFTYPVQSPYGAVGKFDTNTGGALGPLHRPIVMGLDRPVTVAVSGDNLFVENATGGTIGKYNATTGAVINASFISGLQGYAGGIAVVPASTSTTSVIADEWSTLTSFGTLDQFAINFWERGYFVDAVLLLLIAALSLWALIGFLSGRVEAPAVEPTSEAPARLEHPLSGDVSPSAEIAPQNPPGKSAAKPILIGCGLAGLVTLLLGGYMAYQVGTSLYISKLNEVKNQARNEVVAEQEQSLPPVQLAVAPTRETLPAVLVDPENFQTENNWLACVIGRRIADFVHLTLHPDEAALPDIQVHAVVKAEEHQVHLEITGFAADPVVVDLQPDFAWDPQGYAALATKLMGNASSDSGQPGESLPDEVATLPQLTGPNLAHEDVTLSGLLQKHPAWPAAHEDAALLLVAMALRDRAGEYTDYRPMLCRATAHLALAQAFRGSTPPTWAGEIADAGIRALSGREVDALTHLDALSARSDCPEAAKIWIAALRLRAKDDWRLTTPEASSPLLLKIAWFQTLNDNLSSMGALLRLKNLGALDDVPDWGHASLSNQMGVSVEAGNQFCETTTTQELRELGVVLQVENVTPDSTQSIGILLSDPLGEKLFVGQPPVLKIIGPEMFKAFARQHLLMELENTYFWLRDELGVPDDAEKFRSATSDGFAGMRRLEVLGFFAKETYNARAILKELNKEHKTWEPWEIADGMLPGNPNLSNIHPDIDTLDAFYQDGLPFGTAYDLNNRLQTLYIGASRHKKQPANVINFNLPTYPYAQNLRILAPSSYTVFSLDKNNQDLFQTSKSWWDYDLRSIYDTEKIADSLDDEDHTTLLQKHAALEPDAYFQLGKYLRGEGKDDQAADADRKGFDQAFDQVGMSNSVGPLVDYYYDHNRKDEAEMVAKRAADVYSERGLTTYCKLLEKLGRFSEAEQNAQAIADRYDDKSVLDALHAAHKDYFQDQNQVLLDKVFPHGMEKVTFSSFSEAPTSGCIFNSGSALLQQASLQVGDVVVAFDGYRVGNDDQYDYIRALSADPHMDLIIWRKDRYLEVHASSPDRKFQVEPENYQLPTR